MISAPRATVIMAALVFALGCGSSTTPGPWPSGDPATKDRKPEFKLTAVDLAKEYATDTAAADKKYKDKVVEVDAVADIVTDVQEHASVSIGEYKADPKKAIGRMVMAFFPKAEREKVLD